MFHHRHEHARKLCRPLPGVLSSSLVTASKAFAAFSNLEKAFNDTTFLVESTAKEFRSSGLVCCIVERENAVEGCQRYELKHGQFYGKQCPGKVQSREGIQKSVAQPWSARD